MLSRLFIAALWSPAGKGLTSWLVLVMFIVFIFTFPCGILDQVWYLIVSFPDLCPLSYFLTYALHHHKKQNHLFELTCYNKTKIMTHGSHSFRVKDWSQASSSPLTAPEQISFLDSIFLLVASMKSYAKSPKSVCFGLPSNCVHQCLTSNYCYNEIPPASKIAARSESQGRSLLPASTINRGVYGN